MELKVCTTSELKELEDILFEQDLTLSTYTRLMDKVKANYLEHTRFEEKIKTETPPYYWVADRVANPSGKDYLDDINGHFRMPLLSRGGYYSDSVVDGKSVILNYRNFDICMQDVIGLRGKDLAKSRKKLTSWFGKKKRCYSFSEIEKMEGTPEWKGIFNEIMGQKEIRWETWTHSDEKYFFYQDWFNLHLARRIYKVSAVGGELSADLS